jgi:cyclic pyranopterin phosphate synthase
MRIAGVVLAGGQSSRYGKPKMFERYNGLPFYLHSTNALKSSGVDSVYIITNPSLSEQFDANATLLIEKKQHNGPLYALTFAMQSIQDVDWYVVLAADIPFISKDIIDSLLNYAIGSSYDAIVPVTGDKKQTLIAMYHRRCLPLAEELIDNNRKSMQPLLQKAKVNYLHFPSTQREFTNINYESEWQIETDKESNNMSEFSHWNEKGRPKMVDISQKDQTKRTAVAQSTILLKKELYEAIQNSQIKKGDPLQVAQIAGIMAAKKTPDIIPMCHPIQITGVDFQFEYKEATDGYELIIQAEVSCKGNTGVEMEALTAVSAAALTFYDMCKAVDKSMIIKDTFLLSKTGGKNGDYTFGK